MFYDTHYRHNEALFPDALGTLSSAPAAPLVDASHTTDGRKSLDTEHPTYVSLSLKVRTSILGALSAGGGDASVLPVPGVFSEVAACAGYAATRSEDLVDQLRIMVDAIGADEGLRITPAAIIRLCATGQVSLDAIASCGLSPTVPNAAARVVTPAPGAT